MVSLPKAVFVCLKFDPWQELILLSMRGQLNVEGVDVPQYEPHITLTGTTHEAPDALATKIKRKLAALDTKQFKLEIYKFGLYPNQSVLSLIPHPHEGGAMLRWLQYQISKSVFPLNNSFEPENWRPHITLVKALQTKGVRNEVVGRIAPGWEPFSLTAVAIGIKERGKHEDTYTIPLEGL